jgi:chaperonin cofactor prefoldin
MQNSVVGKIVFAENEKTRITRLEVQIKVLENKFDKLAKEFAKIKTKNIRRVKK